jgi:predicted CXXCH cytochrome family protein
VTRDKSGTAGDEAGMPSDPGATSDPMRGWKIAGLIASLVIVSTIPLYAIKESRLRAARRSVTDSVPTFVGRSRCTSCHEAADRAWQGSDHDNAMDVANDSTVLGVGSRFYRKDGGFFVRTEGPDGDPADFEIAYTFGIEPLQQYLIRFPGGRLQVLSLAWDVEQGLWFRMYPGEEIPHDDWLHWTRGAQNWNGMCAECHSTNLVKGYDPASKTFDTSWSEIDVSCEACHGPGSLVVRTSGIDSRQQVELCAPCHSRRTELGGYDHTGADLLDHHIPRLLDEGLYFSDGQILDEVYVYGSFLQSKMYRNDVRCGDCHDVHSLQLVREGNELCLQCHTAAVYDSSDHHFHKKIHEGEPSDGALCVKCHMPERPYMVIDDRADHSLRVPRPDLTLELGVPNACSQSGCHDDKSAQWAADYFTLWYGIARRSHYGTALEAGRQRAPEAGPELIRLAGDPLYPALVRATALSLLGRYPGGESTRAFNRALADDDPLVRYTAVQAVNTADPRELVGLVAPLLADPTKAVRGQAAVRLAPVPRDLLEPYQRAALDSALNEYRTAMSYTLDFAASGHNLGNLYSTLGDPAKAEEYYRTALEIDDLFYPAKMNLAVLYNGQGRNAEAETLLREVVVDYPAVYEAAYSLGLLLVEMERPAEAAEFLAQAADGMPERSRAHYNLGLLLQSLERRSEAEAALQAALELEPESLEYLYALADHYVKRGEPARALPLAERMIAAHPDDPLGPELKAFLERSLQAQE